MDALLAAAAAVAGDTLPIRVVLVPTAVARHRPELAAAHGTRAFEAAAARAGRAVEVRVAMVVDRASATDEAHASMLESADLIHLPGGDPDVIPTVLRRDGGLGGVPAGARRGCVPRRRERRGDGARRPPLDAARSHGRARAGARDRRAPPLPA